MANLNPYLKHYIFTSSTGLTAHSVPSLLRHTGFISADTIRRKLMVERPSGTFIWKDVTWTYTPVYAPIKVEPIVPVKRGRPTKEEALLHPRPKVIRTPRPRPTPVDIADIPQKPSPEPTVQLYQLHDRKTGEPLHTVQLVISPQGNLMRTISI